MPKLYGVGSRHLFLAPRDPDSNVQSFLDDFDHHFASLLDSEDSEPDSDLSILDIDSYVDAIDLRRAIECFI